MPDGAIEVSGDVCGDSPRASLPWVKYIYPYYTFPLYGKLYITQIIITTYDPPIIYS